MYVHVTVHVHTYAIEGTGSATVLAGFAMVATWGIRVSVCACVCKCTLYKHMYVHVTVMCTRMQSRVQVVLQY